MASLSDLWNSNLGIKVGPSPEEGVDQIRQLTPRNPLLDFPMQFARNIGLVPGASAGRSAMASMTSPAGSTINTPVPREILSAIPSTSPPSHVPGQSNIQDLLIPPTMPSAGGVVPASRAVSPEDQALANARNMAGPSMTGKDMNVLPWDFWAKNPDVSGGMAKIQRFDDQGNPMPIETRSMFEANKPPNIMDMIQPLIQDYSSRLSAFGNMPTGNIKEMTDKLNHRHFLDAYSKGFGGLLDKILASSKLPGEIEKTGAETTHLQTPQVIPNIYSGKPGDVSSFLLPPGGGRPTQFATGAHQEKTQIEDQLKARVLPEYIQGLFTSAANEFDPVKRQQLMNAAGQITAAVLSGEIQNYKPQMTRTPPSKEQWLAAAKKANPGKKDQELLDFYNKTYGR